MFRQADVQKLKFLLARARGARWAHRSRRQHDWTWKGLPEPNACSLAQDSGPRVAAGRGNRYTGLNCQHIPAGCDGELQDFGENEITLLEQIVEKAPRARNATRRTCGWCGNGHGGQVWHRGFYHEGGCNTNAGGHGADTARHRALVADVCSMLIRIAVSLLREP